ARAERADDLGVLPARGHRLDHQTQLVSRGITPGLGRAHDAVAAVHVVVELVAPTRLAPALLHLRARPADDGVDVADRVRIADPRDGHRSLADLPRAFQLDAIDGVAPEVEPTDSGGALVDLLVATVRHVQRTAGDVLEEGARPLVHGVTRDRGHRAALPWMHRGDRDGIRGHGADDALLAHERL